MNSGAPPYESTDASTAAVLGSAAAVALGVLLTLGVSWLIMRPVTTEPLGNRAFEHGVEVETPMQRDWQAAETEARGHLESYGWVDRPAGVAHIPIGRAMEILVAQGSPTGKVER
ncbi:MAG TPA: hypothetical protein VHD32_14460 [Candidatus Didemnitutus sp.]|nr:hypothetical protein [Candidatus Didemnitutus sp.]